MAKPTRVPGIPKPPSDVSPGLRGWLSSVAEALEIRLGRRGDPKDRAVTLRELIDSGLAQDLKAAAFDPNNVNRSNIGFSPNTVVDSTVPPQPSNFSAAAAYSQVNLSWDYPNYSNHSFSEIYGHDSDVIGDAQLIGVSTGRVYIDPIGGGASRYYWIRHVSTSSVLGPWNSGTGTLGQTATDTATLLAELEGSIPAVAFATGIEPISVVNSLPSVSGYTGPQVVLLSTDGKLYRLVNNGWTAAVPTTDLSGTIATLQLADDAVTNAKIAVDAIQGDVIAASAITADKILSGAITSLKLADDAVTNAKIATNAIQGDVIAAGAITNTKVSDGAIETAKIAANAITSAKISAGAVTANEIASNAITSAKISAGAVTANEIASNAITAAKIASGAIETEKLAANAITAAKIAAGAVTATEIASNSITSAKIQAGAVTASEIASNAITAVKIAADAVTADKIATNAVTADAVEAGAITAGAISAGAINTSNIIADGVIVGDKIAANTITGAKIQAGSVNADRIQAGTITGDRISTNSIEASKLQIDTNVLAEASNGDLILATGSATKGVKFENLSNDAVGVIAMATQSGNKAMSNINYNSSVFFSSTPWSEYTYMADDGEGGYIQETETLPELGVNLTVPASVLQETGTYYVDFGAQVYGYASNSSSTSSSMVVMDVYQKNPTASTYSYYTSRVTNISTGSILPLTTRAAVTSVNLNKDKDYQFKLFGYIKGLSNSSDGTKGMHSGNIRVIRIHKST